MPFRFSFLGCVPCSSELIGGSERCAEAKLCHIIIRESEGKAANMSTYLNGRTRSILLNGRIFRTQRREIASDHSTIMH